MAAPAPLPAVGPAAVALDCLHSQPEGARWLLTPSVPGCKRALYSSCKQLTAQRHARPGPRANGAAAGWGKAQGGGHRRLGQRQHWPRRLRQQVRQRLWSLANAATHSPGHSLSNALTHPPSLTHSPSPTHSLTSQFRSGRGPNRALLRLLVDKYAHLVVYVDEYYTSQVRCDLHKAMRTTLNAHVPYLAQTYLCV